MRQSLRAIFLLACLLALAGCGRVPRLAPLPNDAVILAFGDSLTYGTGAEASESYPAILEQIIHRKVIRAGVPGEMSGEGLARLPEVLDRAQPRLMILCHGGNDLLRRSGESAAEANLRAMVRMAKERGIAVLMVAVPKPGLLLSPPDYYKKVAADNQAPIESKALAAILSNNALKSDAAHPNASGYRQLAQAVAELLKKAGAV